MEVMAPMIQGMNNGKEFLIIDVIVLFCRGERLREIRTGMKISVIVFLHEDSSTGKERSVGHDNEGTMNIWEVNHWSGLKVR